MATKTESQHAELVAYKAGLAKKANSGPKKSNTYYFPIGRTITTIGGVMKMVNSGNVIRGVQALMNGDFYEMTRRFGNVFEGGDVKGGAKVVAAGIVLGKTLDHTKVNPRLKMGKYGVKLV